MEQEAALNQPGFLLASTGYLLARLGAESRRMWGEMLAEYGLTPHQFGVLMTLAQLKAASQRQLSLAVGVDPRNAVPIIDALERLGLVERGSDAADRRRHAVTLTADGHAMTGRLRQAGAELENRFLALLSSQERDALHAILTKLVTSVMRAAG
jgi:DNA-binding MarR family transcriptional regulator